MIEGGPIRLALASVDLLLPEVLLARPYDETHGL